MRIALLATYFLMLLASPALAQANDPMLPPPDPPGTWHKLTHDEATTTSRCIGNPVTPLCAVETFLACFLHHRPELCDMVQAGVRPLADMPRTWHRWEEYRVVHARRPSPLDPIDRASEGNMKPQSGDVVITLMLNSCFKEPGGGSGCILNVENDPPYTHMLRQQGDLWVYVYRFRPRF